MNIWVFQNVPFPPREDLLAIIEDTVRFSEEFLGVPFPTKDIVLLVMDKSYRVRGIHGGTHMALVRHDELEVEVPSVPHETAHYYFDAGSTGPRWLTEGAAEFIEGYVNDMTGVQDLDDRKLELSKKVKWKCLDSKDLENIRHYTYLYQDAKGIFDLCTYHLGEHFLHALSETMGQEAMRAALRELLLRELVKEPGLDRQAVEDRIYLTFLKHTPSDRKEEVRILYRRMHGGPHQDPEADLSDDHGDEASSASLVEMGETVGGTLDHMWDFDYFRFHAEEGQVYQVNVTHETLRASNIYVYAADGLTKQKWMFRHRVPSGPRFVWESQNSGEHYFAVHNFDGKTGRYTLTISPLVTDPDDHGDTPTTATHIPVEAVVKGSIDHESDFDVFRFEAVEGRQYSVSLRFGTLEDGRVSLYTSEHGGSGPGGHSISGPAWSTGAHYYIVFGLHGAVGTYSLVTDGDKEPNE